MPKDGTSTKERILEESQKLLLSQGYAGMSIDQILEKTGITKGAFFYHFKSKIHLALALINKYAENDKHELEHALSDTESYVNNPRERLLRFMQWFIDVMEDFNDIHPGCLYASYMYEPGNFDDEIRGIVANAIITWNKTMLGMIEETAKQCPPVIPVNYKSLADQFIVIFEGAFIVTRAVGQENVTAAQLLHLKNYLELLFPEKVS